MQRALSLYETSIGKKAIMAVTGVVLYGFVIAHMLGNLQIFLGPEAYNGYAEGLKAVPALLWGARGVLLLSLVAHMWASFSLAGRNAKARPQAYAAKTDLITNFAAKTMMLGGPIIFLFIIFHLLHFTVGAITPGGYDHSVADVYGNFIASFTNAWVVVVYVVAQTLVAMHLYHGVWSVFQTLGLNHPRYNAGRRAFATAVATLVGAANIAMPLAVYFRFVE